MRTVSVDSSIGVAVVGCMGGDPGFSPESGSQQIVGFLSLCPGGAEIPRVAAFGFGYGHLDSRSRTVSETLPFSGVNALFLVDLLGPVSQPVPAQTALMTEFFARI